MSLVVSATVPAVVGSVIVMSPDGLPPTRVVSLLSAVDPSKTTPLLVLTVSTLAVVVVPVTTKLPGIVIVSSLSPMVSALEGILALSCDFKLARVRYLLVPSAKSPVS